MTLRGLLSDPGVVGTWMLVPERSSVRFTNSTLWGLMRVTGQFTAIEGRGRIDAGNRVAGRLVIAAASLSTGITRRDKHLRSRDFFDTDRFPDIVVEVTAVAPNGDHSAALDAGLSVRGVTRPLPLQATVTRLGNDTIHVVGRADIDRTAWGVGGNAAGMLPTTTALVADTIFVNV